MSKASQRAKELAEYRAEQKFHEREWVVQRIGWAVVALIVIAGVAGVFGSGPIARHTMKTGDTRIELDRFIRYDSASQWRLLPGSSTSPSPLRIYIDSSLVEQYEITTITPEPARCRAGNSRIGAAFGHQVRGARAKRKDLDHPEQVAT